MHFLSHLFAGPERLLPLLVPRLVCAVPEDEVAVPSPIPGAVWALTFDHGKSTRPLLRSRSALYRLTPELAFQRAVSNLRAAASPNDAQQHPSEPSVRVCAPRDGSGPNRLLVLGRVLPETNPALGVLAAIPTTDILLLHLVSAESAAAPVTLHLMAQRVFAGADNPVSDRIFWCCHGTTAAIEIVSSPSQIQWTAGSVTEAFWEAVSRACHGA